MPDAVPSRGEGGEVAFSTPLRVPWTFSVSNVYEFHWSMDRLSADDFDGLRLKRPEPYAVVFAADWCPFCRSFLPRFQAREGSWPTHLALADVSDLKSPWWDTFTIKVVPSVLGFREGNLVWRVDGRRFRGLSDRDLDRMGELARVPSP